MKIKYNEFIALLIDRKSDILKCPLFDKESIMEYINKTVKPRQITVLAICMWLNVEWNKVNWKDYLK